MKTMNEMINNWIDNNEEFVDYIINKYETDIDNASDEYIADNSFDQEEFFYDAYVDFVMYAIAECFAYEIFGNCRVTTEFLNEIKPYAYEVFINACYDEDKFNDVSYNQYILNIWG